MKVRYGFVANSSTSSFLIAGIYTGIQYNKGMFPDGTVAPFDIPPDMFEFLKNIGLFDIDKGRYLERISPNMGIEENVRGPFVCVGTDVIDYVGIWLEPLLNKGKSLPQIKRELVKSFKEYGLVVKPTEVGIFYGEAGTG